MKSLSPVKEAHEFQDCDLIAGHAALDFVNTVTGRNGVARDWLLNPEALIAWGLKASILSRAESRALRVLYSAESEVAAKAHSYAIEVREALHEFIAALASESDPADENLERIAQHWHIASRDAVVRWAGSAGFNLEISSGDPNVIAKRIVLSFVALGPRLSTKRLGKCPGCAWFFLDTSKAGRRRWCDMAVCGNAAKYARTKGIAN